MAQAWINSPKTDSVFILAPSFVVLCIVFFFHDWLLVVEKNYSFYTWFFLIVFIDVAHVYATLFKTYFIKTEFQQHKRLYIGLPVFCFCIGFFLFLFGSQVFWSVLAYVAVFHFIRQQYGFMRLYARYEAKTFAWIDNLFIYTATIYPMLFWFLSPKRQFNWFIENEFLTYDNPLILKICSWFYYTILFFYLSRLIYIFIKTKVFNLPKNAIIIGTFLSWYFGIVYYNNDLVFTLLNVVSHGIPYMALIYFNQVDGKQSQNEGLLYNFRQWPTIFFFITICCLIAFSEEFLWEILVWNEQFSLSNFNASSWQFVLIPLLTVPQFTHYLLDGFIWKSKK